MNERHEIVDTLALLRLRQPNLVRKVEAYLAQLEASLAEAKLDKKRLDKLEQEVATLRTRLNTLEYRAAVEV